MARTEHARVLRLQALPRLVRQLSARCQQVLDAAQQRALAQRAREDAAERAMRLLQQAGLWPGG